MQKMENWAHRLYPKLQFEEFIDRVERLGKKKEVQVESGRRLDTLTCFFCTALMYLLFSADLSEKDPAGHAAHAWRLHRYQTRFPSQLLAKINVQHCTLLEQWDITKYGWTYRSLLRRTRWRCGYFSVVAITGNCCQLANSIFVCVLTLQLVNLNSPQLLLHQVLH